MGDYKSTALDQLKFLFFLPKGFGLTLLVASRGVFRLSDFTYDAFIA